MHSLYPRASSGSSSTKLSLCWQLTHCRVGHLVHVLGKKAFGYSGPDAAVPDSLRHGSQLSMGWPHEYSYFSEGPGGLVLGHTCCWVDNAHTVLSDAATANLRVECGVSPLASVFVSGSWDVTLLERRVSWRDTLFPLVIGNYKDQKVSLKSLEWILTLRIWTRTSSWQSRHCISRTSLKLAKPSKTLSWGAWRMLLGCCCLLFLIPSYLTSKNQPGLTLLRFPRS